MPTFLSTINSIRKLVKSLIYILCDGTIYKNLNLPMRNLAKRIYEKFLYINIYIVKKVNKICDIINYVIRVNSISK